jgi:hypothetical protein
MAISGNGREYDITMKCGGGVNTSTSQYRVVGMGYDTTSADWTAYMTDYNTALSDTMTSRGALGIQQDYLSSSSEYCTVRIHGLSKAYCAGSVSAGDFVRAYEGTSVTSRFGNIVTLALTTTITTGIILGRALEDGSTGTVITVLLQPNVCFNI